MSESPAKKLDFTFENKENSNVAVPIAGIPDLPERDEVENSHPSVASTIKPEEAHEPLLQENPQRFVLFPIQNHEVSYLPTRCYALDAPSRSLLITSTDLENVQESHGLILDCRRNRSKQGHSRLE